jgi:hypothetical protein
MQKNKIELVKITELDGDIRFEILVNDEIKKTFKERVFPAPRAENLAKSEFDAMIIRAKDGYAKKEVLFSETV